MVTNTFMKKIVHRGTKDGFGYLRHFVDTQSKSSEAGLEAYDVESRDGAKESLAGCVELKVVSTATDL
jgi:hypothetical protein